MKDITRLNIDQIRCVSALLFQIVATLSEYLTKIVMVFIFFGATPDSWAMGNDKFSACNNLPMTLQNAWDRLAQVQIEPSLAGTIISWLSATPDGTSYAIMTKGGERALFF